MSDFKLIEVLKKTSGQETQSIYSHTNKDALIAAMDNDFGVQVKNQDVVSVYCLAIDNDTGILVDRRYYVVSNEEVDTAIRSRVYTHNNYSEDNISAYDSYRDALGNYYTKKAAAMSNPECNHAVTILINGSGDCVERSNWTREE